MCLSMKKKIHNNILHNNNKIKTNIILTLIRNMKTNNIVFVNI